VLALDREAEEVREQDLAGEEFVVVVVVVVVAVVPVVPVAVVIGRSFKNCS